MQEQEREKEQGCVNELQFGFWVGLSQVLQLEGTGGSRKSLDS